MELNTAATKIVNSDNQENNLLLLNAIKNKFAAQTSAEAASFSPPKFDIPLLKIPGTINSDNAANRNSKISGSQHNNAGSSQLNNFLLKQLQEKHTNNTLPQQQTGFVLPQLQTSSNSKANLKFEIPALATKPNTHVISLTTAINNLQAQENTNVKPINISSSAAIDLSSALASKLQIHQGTPPTRDFIRPQNNSNDQDFDIPFIDCDRWDNSRKGALILPTSNEYCITDISQLLLHHSLVEPSAVGRFLSFEDNKYTAPLPLKLLSVEYRQQSVKHQIEPFRFETKSPDELVQEALNKYQRRHYN